MCSIDNNIYSISWCAIAEMQSHVSKGVLDGDQVSAMKRLEAFRAAGIAGAYSGSIGIRLTLQAWIALLM